MATSLQLPSRVQYFDLQGGVVVPAAGYLLDTFINGTTTPEPTFTDVPGLIANTNPIVLNAEGKADVFLTVGKTYTFRLRRTAALGGGTVQTINDISGVPLPFTGSFLPLAGGSMTGPLILAGNASTNLGAVTRQQLNAAISSVTAAAVAAVGTPVPVGALMLWTLAAPPAGYLECNGAAVGRATYAALFAAIGTSYGVGDGSTTFTLPDLRGEFVRGLDNGRGVDSGRAIGSAQAGQNAAHTHSIGPFFRGKADGNAPINPEGVVFDIPGPTAIPPATGSSGGTEARPRNVALMYIVRF